MKLIYNKNDLPTIDKTAYLYLDTETEKKFAKIRLVQLYQEGWEEPCLVDIHKVDLIDVYQHIKDCHLVGHNLHYDFTCFLKDLGEFAKFKHWDDTFLAGRLELHWLRSFSLDSMFEAVYGRDIYADVGDQSKSKWKGELNNKQLAYSAYDVFYLPTLWHRVKNKRDSATYKIDKLTIEHILDFQFNGMPISEELYSKEIIFTQAEIDGYTEHLPKGFNCNSYRQVRSYLSSTESDDLALAKMIAEGNEKAKWVRGQRAAKKKQSFLTKFSSVDLRVRGHFNVATRSGRFNCQEQNIQQIPRSLKHIFGFKEDDHKVLVYSDYAQLELRTICALLGERVMEKLFREDRDLHIYAASIIYNKRKDEITKEERQIAKTANFGLLYGAGVNMFQQILLKLTGKDLSIDEVKFIRDKWRTLYPTIIAWQERNISNYRRGLKTASTALGRIYTANIYTDLNNIQNQGTGAEVTKLALHYLLKNNSNVKVLNVVHDSILLECDVDEVERVSKALGDSMLEGWVEVSKFMEIKDLPMPVTVTAGYNWGSIEDKYIHKYEVSNG